MQPSAGTVKTSAEYGVEKTRIGGADPSEYVAPHILAMNMAAALPMAPCDRRRLGAGKGQMPGVEETWIHEIVSGKILHNQEIFTHSSFTEPEVVKRELLSVVRGYLGPDYDIDSHFTPKYRPWR